MHCTVKGIRSGAYPTEVAWANCTREMHSSGRTLAQSYGSISDRLMQVLAQSANLANDGRMNLGTGERNVRQRIEQISRDQPAARVADARFALGADDGAYLRSNVMPLQTTDDACDGTSLTARPLREVEAASRRGVLRALADDFKDRIAQTRSELKDTIDLVSWLLSITEIAQFANLKHDMAQRNAERTTPAERRAMEIIKMFVNGTKHAAAKVMFMDSVNTLPYGDEVACLIVSTVLAIFGVPAEAVRQQLDVTLGSASTKGSGTDTLHDALDRLALSARFTKAVFDADKVPIHSDPARVREMLVEAAAAKRAARGANAAISGRIDLGEAAPPAAFNMAYEHAAAGSSDASMGIMQRFLWNVDTNATLEELQSSRPNPELATWDEEQRDRTMAGRFVNRALNTKPAERIFAPDEVIASFKDAASQKRKKAEDATRAVDDAILELEGLEAKLVRYSKTSMQYKLAKNDIELANLKVSWQTALAAAMNLYRELLLADAVLIEQINAFVDALESNIESAAKLLNKGAGTAENDLAVEKVTKAYNDFFPQGGWFQVTDAEDAASKFTPGGQVRDDGAAVRANRWRFAMARILEFASIEDEATFDAAVIERRTRDNDTIVQEGWLGALAGRRPEQTMLADLRAVQKKATKGDEDVKALWPTQAFVTLFAAAKARNALVMPAYTATKEARSAQAKYDKKEAENEAERQQLTEEEQQQLRAASEKTKALFAALKGKANPGHCVPGVYLSTEDLSRENVTNGLCAAFTQMREGGGFSTTTGPDQTQRLVERRAGISPFFYEPRWRPLSDEAEDWWTKRIWSVDGQRPGDVPLADLPRRLDDAMTFRSNLPSVAEDAVSTASRGGASSSAGSSTGDTDGPLPAKGLSRALEYALARGLCAKRAPHHVPRDGETDLAYNLPMLPWTARKAPAKQLQPTPEERSEQLMLFSSRALEPKVDFVSAPLPHAAIPDEPVEEPTKVALWAPVVPRYTADKHFVFAASDRNGAREVADAVVHEVLVDYYKEVEASAATHSDDAMRLLAKGAAAYAKVLQLPSLTWVMSHENKAMLCPAHPGIEWQASLYGFFTRPVLRCPGVDNFILYPCDAGMAAYSVYVGEDIALDEQSRPTEGVAPPERDKAFGAAEQVAAASAAPAARNQVLRSEATAYMRSALGRSEGSSDGSDLTVQERRSVPLYVAAAPGGDGDEINNVISAMNAATNSDNKQAIRGTHPVKLPTTDEDIAALRPDALVSVLRSAFAKCTSLASYRCELTAVEKRLEEEDEHAAQGHSYDDDDPMTPDAAARERREAVWNDAMREACISGDRLYAFARQLAGTISEQVDSICMIDEGLLIRQQQDRLASRQRLTDRAAQEHMNLVRSVFAAVIKESGLTLGIDKQGDVASLKVVSNTLRKQASELASGGSSSEGYFANSVRLENLLASGTGELTLSDLFQRLGDAGKALQQAALSSQPTETATGVSIDFLSAPRNSLLLRWKPESLAAVRQAFDLFQRELLSLHGPTYRAISAYELIEGCDDSLCSAFAQFCAHCLVHSRLYSSSTAMCTHTPALNSLPFKPPKADMNPVRCFQMSPRGQPRPTRRSLRCPCAG